MNPQATAALQDLAKALANLQGVVDKILKTAAGTNAASSAVDGFNTRLQAFGVRLGSARDALLGFLTGIEKGLASLGSQFTRFVQLANPGTVIRFNRAVENFQAAIGQILTPVLERLTQIVQKLANAIVSLSDPVKSLTGGLALGAALSGVLAGVIQAVSLVVKVLGGWVTTLLALGAAVIGVATATSGWAAVSKAMDGILKAVGTAIQSIAKPIGQVLSAIGNALAPLIDALGPVIEFFGQIAGVLLQIVAIPINLLAGVLKILAQALAPVIKLVATFAQLFATLAEGGVKVLTELLAELAETLSGPIIAAVEAFAAAVEELIRRVLAVIAKVREFFGLDPAYNPNAKQAQAVVKNASIGDVQSFLKRAYEQSATQGGSTVEQKQLDKLGGIEGAVKDLPKQIAEELRKDKGTAPENKSLVDRAPVLPIPFGPDIGDLRQLWKKVF